MKFILQSRNKTLLGQLRKHPDCVGIFYCTVYKVEKRYLYTVNRESSQVLLFFISFLVQNQVWTFYWTVNVRHPGVTNVILFRYRFVYFLDLTWMPRIFHNLLGPTKYRIKQKTAVCSLGVLYNFKRTVSRDFCHQSIPILLSHL